MQDVDTSNGQGLIVPSTSTKTTSFYHLRSTATLEWRNRRHRPPPPSPTPAPGATGGGVSKTFFQSPHSRASPPTGPPLPPHAPI
ncbi:hypothetical protein AHAS_Ahas06G0202400 [Arachis hypogaea]